MSYPPLIVLVGFWKVLGNNEKAKIYYPVDLNYEFKDDGTGFLPNLNITIDTDKFEWIYQDEPRKVMIRRITNDV